MVTEQNWTRVLISALSTALCALNIAEFDFEYLSACNHGFDFIFSNRSPEAAFPMISSTVEIQKGTCAVPVKYGYHTGRATVTRR